MLCITFILYLLGERIAIQDDLTLLRVDPYWQEGQNIFDGVAYLASVSITLKNCKCIIWMSYPCRYEMAP